MSVDRFTLSGDQRRELEQLGVSELVPVRVAWRARLLLARCAAASDREVAARTGTARATVALWRRRYEEDGIAGLHDRPRPGRRRLLSAATDPAMTSVGGATSVADATLERLLAAASRTISRRGFNSTRMADIADEAGVSPAMLHYYFKSKQEILVQSLLWANERLLMQLTNAISVDAPPLVQLAKFIERTILYPGTQREEYLLEIDLWTQARLHPTLLSKWEAYGERWIGQLRAIIAAGAANGSFSVVAPVDEVAERIVSMTDGLSAWVGIGAARMSAERARLMLLRFVAEQVGVPVSDLEHHAQIEGITPRQPESMRAPRVRTESCA